MGGQEERESDLDFFWAEWVVTFGSIKLLGLFASETPLVKADDIFKYKKKIKKKIQKSKDQLNDLTNLKKAFSIKESWISGKDEKAYDV